jgi:hypothetical protein
MKKTLTTITLAVVLTLGSTFAFGEGIIVAGKSQAPTCTTTEEGIIVAGKAFVGILFGIIVAGNPSAQCVENEGIIVAG